MSSSPQPTPPAGGAARRLIAGPTELAAGLFLLVVAALAWWFAQPLKVGTAYRMGPGYVPILLAWITGAFGAVLASFAAYTVEKKIARDPSRFGKGAVEGVAGPESANNAAAQTSFIPMLTLGIPSNAVMALMVGAMIIQGIEPGPEVMTKRPDLFWGMIASMWVGNLMLVIINLPMIGMWVSLLRVPYRLMFPAIVLFCCIGVYTLNNSTLEVMMAAGFGLMGYGLLKFGFEPTRRVIRWCSSSGR